MTIEQDSQLYTGVSMRKQVGRLLERELFDIAFQNIVIDEAHVLEEVKESTQRGEGLIILFNHPSSRDPIALFQGVIFQPGFIDKQITSPMAYHQFGKTMRALSRVGSFPVYPIVTSDSEAHLRDRGILFSEEYKQTLMEEYLRHAIEVLAYGGIVPLAPQAGRRKRLYEKPLKKGFPMLYNEIEKHPDLFQRVNVLYVGIHIENADYDEETTRGFNVLKRYQLRIGRFSSLGTIKSETLALMDCADENPRFKAKFMTALNEYIYEELSHVVHPSYVGNK